MFVNNNNLKMILYQILICKFFLLNYLTENERFRIVAPQLAKN